jgi:flagellar biosynthesis protein
MKQSANNMQPDKHYTQSAVALAYEAGDLAPRVVAKGKGLLAERIIAIAKEHDVYVHESQALLGLLMQVELDAHIPPQLYQAIAEIPICWWNSRYWAVITTISVTPAYSSCLDKRLPACCAPAR